MAKECERGPCCTPDEKFVSFEQSRICSIPLDECKGETTCDETSARCPELPKTDGFPCAGSSKVCIDGICKGSICVIHKYLDCQCKDNCEVCCQKTVNESCERASDLGLKTNNDKRYLKKLGDQCMEELGYCNYEGRCEHFLTAPLAMRIQHDITLEINMWFMQNWMLSVAIAFVILYVIKLRLFRSVKDDTLQLQHFFMEIRKTRHILGFFPKAQEASRYMEDGIVQLSRLVALFPTVSLEIHGDCVRQIGVEDEIVKMFLLNGVPIRMEFVENVVYPKLRRGIVIPESGKNVPSTAAGPSGISSKKESGSTEEGEIEEEEEEEEDLEEEEQEDIKSRSSTAES